MDRSEFISDLRPFRKEAGWQEQLAHLCTHKEVNLHLVSCVCGFFSEHVGKMFSYKVLTTFNSNPANKKLFVFTTIKKGY